MPATTVSKNIQSSHLIGQLLPGYRLIRRRGWGGVAEVWEAEAPGGFLVALKLVRLSGKVSSGELRAMEVFRGIRHPNLLPIFGAWQDEDLLILGMELADRSLWDRFLEVVVQGLRGIPRQELLGYLADAAAGIDFLNSYRHSIEGREGLGIQHRDLKPQNILLFGASAKVADFGMVRVMDRTTTSHTGTWTLPYAAPEFFSGHTSSQSDQYSLAVTYCQLRGGRLPFSGTPAEIMAGHLFTDPDLAGLPGPERPIVARALAKQPEQRWPDCRSFIEALRALGSNGNGAVPDVLAGQESRDAASLVSESFFLSADPHGVPEAKGRPDWDMTTPTLSRTPERSSGRSGRLRARWILNSCLSAGVAVGLVIAAEVRAPAVSSRPAPPSVSKPLANAVPKQSGSGGVALSESESVPAAIPNAKDTPPSGAEFHPEQAHASDEHAKPAHPAVPVQETASASRAILPAERSEPTLTSADSSGQDTPAEAVAPAQAPSIVQPMSPHPDLWAPADATERTKAEGEKSEAHPTPEPGAVEGPNQVGGLLSSVAPTVPPLTKTPDVGSGTRGEPEPSQPPAQQSPGTPPDAARQASARGRTLLDQHAYSEAVAAFTKAIQLAPKDPETYFNRGMAHHLNGSYREALADYNDALRLGPNEDIAASTRLLRGRVYHVLGHRDRALADLSKAIALRPGDAHAYLARGSVYHDLGSYDRALTDYTEAIRLRPNDPRSLYRRGLVRYHSGDYVGAIADFNEVINLDPYHAGTYRARGDAYARLGDGAHAAADHDASHRLSADRTRKNSSTAPAPRPPDLPATDKDHTRAPVEQSPVPRPRRTRQT